MTTHLYHDRTEETGIPDAVLFEGCERCAEHASTLYDLDDANLVRLVERGEVGEGLTFVERTALNNLRVAAMVLRRAGYEVAGG